MLAVARYVKYAWILLVGLVGAKQQHLVNGDAKQAEAPAVQCLTLVLGLAFFIAQR
ncbi:hypothetical protein D3C81_2331030 [compost metagenome]